MPEAHRSGHVADARFNVPVEDLAKSLDRFEVPEKEQAGPLAVLGPTKPSIVPL